LGSERGEQPLSRGSSASKSLVVFWFSFDIKREQSALMKERSGPRGAQSHLTERIKPAPRHQRENLLKEELTLMQSKLPLRYSFTAKINF
jgi:hypothetical protein